MSSELPSTCRFLDFRDVSSTHLGGARRAKPAEEAEEAEEKEGMKRRTSWRGKGYISNIESRGLENI